MDFVLVQSYLTYSNIGWGGAANLYNYEQNSNIEESEY